MTVFCNYCGKPARLVDSSCVYGRSYGMIYYCADCNAWVGVHRHNNKPLGILANAQLRQYKKRAHLYFDRLWKSKRMTRSEAYEWLSKQLGKKPEKTHIGMFEVGDCQQVIKVVSKFWADVPQETI